MGEAPARAEDLAAFDEPALPGRGTPTPLSATRYGRYVLLDRLGTGGMAEVFRALVVGPEQFQSMLVVKRILPHLCANPSFVKMFIDEARLCGLLSHPNIIRVQDFGQQDGQYFLAMEYLPGRNLSAIIRRALERRQMVPPAIAAEIIRQACRGLAYAHGLGASDGKPYGIIHRDVSPGNVMVTQSGAVKVLDFGVARVENRFRRALTDPGRLKGKAAYLAPEQMVSGPFDHRVDVFAAGILLHELLTGRRLFKGETSLDSMKLVKSMVLRPPSSWHSQVPAELDAIVLRALERSPDARYQSAGEMADALEQFLLGARFSSQELPGYMTRQFQQDLEDEKLSLSPDDLQAVMGRELSEKIITQLGKSDGVAATRTSTATSASVSQSLSGGPESRTPGAGSGDRPAPPPALIDGWPDPPSNSDAPAAPRRRTGVAVGAALVGLMAIGAVAVLGRKHLGHKPVVVAAVEVAAPTTREPASPPATRAVAAAPVTPATVQISITSMPPRALVWKGTGTTPLGLTPLVVPVARGTEAVSFRISKTGYLDGRLTVIPDIDQPALMTLAKVPTASTGQDQVQNQKVRNALPTDPFAD